MPTPTEAVHLALDMMSESTDEFIADGKVSGEDTDERQADSAALDRVRDLFETMFGVDLFDEIADDDDAIDQRDLPLRDRDDECFHFDRPLTVGQLRALMVDLPNDTQVTIATRDWYTNVEGVGTPGGEQELWPSVCLFPHPDENVDPRQF